MVKGISKHVIVVKTPVGNIFDEAIFILNESAASASSVNADSLLYEACAVADEYVRSNCTESRQKKKRRIPVLTIICSICSALLTSLGFLLFMFFL